MATKTKGLVFKFPLKNGPGKFDLMVALFRNEKVHFVMDGLFFAGGLPVRLDSLKAIDFDGRSGAERAIWQFTGRIVSNIEIQPQRDNSLLPRSARFIATGEVEGEYNSRTRAGMVTLLHCKAE